MYSLLFDPEEHDAVDAGTITAKILVFLLLILSVMGMICLFAGVLK